MFSKRKIDDTLDATIEQVSSWRQLANEWEVPKTLQEEINSNLRLSLP
ncbi:MAG: hypothetical protein WBK07_04895 [Porticoccaceae bacterium]